MTFHCPFFDSGAVAQSYLLYIKAAKKARGKANFLARNKKSPAH
jgi:hypothetical protein